MSFLVPIMALGVAAALIPLAIYLRNRSRHQVVQWGAMHLLESVLRTNRRRIRFEQLLLLVTRMAIPAAIALFMARPVLTGWQALPGDAKRSVVVVLDNSYSMEAGGGSASAFAKARRAADTILAELPHGSDAVIVPLVEVEDLAFGKATVDLAGLRRHLASAPEGFGRAGAATALESALARLGEMGYADRELVVLSDFQRSSWGENETTGLKRCAATLQALAVKPHVTFMRIGGEHADNISVATLNSSLLAIGAGQATRLTATIRNDSTKARSGLRVNLAIDGQPSETTEISVGAGEQAQVMFNHAFANAGSHYAAVAIDAGDAITADNTMLKTLRVWDRIPVLLVNGEPSGEALRGETDYLEIALQPFAMTGRLSDLVRATVIEAGALDRKVLSGVRVAVLANVATLTPEQVTAVEDFVRSGGGLLLFAGSKMDHAWFNTALAGGNNGLMPLKVGPAAGSVTDHDQQTTIAGDHFEHEALAMFNIPDNGTIAGAEVWMWLPPENPSALKAGGDALTVLTKLANGDPLLVEHRLGEGRVIFCTTACDADWSNLPMRPAYVPLMQQLVTYLASSIYPPTNVEAGGELALFLPLEQAGAQLSLLFPGGGRQDLAVKANGPRAVAAFRPAEQPGLYTFSGKNVAPTHFAVNAAREESDLRMLEDKQLAEVAATLGAEIVKSPEEYTELQSRRRHGREIWRYLFGGALALLLLEMMLENRFARRAA